MKTIIEIATSQVLGATYSTECLETEVLIDELLQVEMVKPYFNFDTREFYEGATPAEIEQAFRDKTPAEVQLWRLRTILNLMNLIATIENALDQLPEPNKTAAKNVWNYGTTVERYSQTVLFIQSVTQMTDDQVDEIFQQAEAIVI
jgi:phage-related protein